ncbi:MAG: hypothetical protein DHS80DRAFT_26978 [Piptocephalis tieghemiana]|nr:MAG: hypothetical protein DHS80DRAFT_26978 [Piptocephalis tieghemiana]
MVAVPLFFRQARPFLLPFYPIVAYLTFFSSQKFIPATWRPTPNVLLLPILDETIFGSGLSRALAANTHPILDLIAWVPYGILHFTLPVICAITLGLVDQGFGGVARYARAYGFMNLSGVVIQLLFPAVPPWYITNHGLRPPTYDDPGSPAGLARVDALLNTHLYTGAFTKSPVPYGAFPSLHAAVATLTSLTLLHLHARHRGFSLGVALASVSYIFFLLWSTMYLGHHWMIDLCAGAALGVGAFALSVRGWVPGERQWWRLKAIFRPYVHTSLPEGEKSQEEEVILDAIRVDRQEEEEMSSSSTTQIGKDKEEGEDMGGRVYEDEIGDEQGSGR